MTLSNAFSPPPPGDLRPALIVLASCLLLACAALPKVVTSLSLRMIACLHEHMDLPPEKLFPLCGVTAAEQTAVDEFLSSAKRAGVRKVAPGEANLCPPQALSTQTDAGAR